MKLAPGGFLFLTRRERRRKSARKGDSTGSVDSFLQLGDDVLEPADRQKQECLERSQFKRRRLVLGRRAARHLEILHHLDHRLCHRFRFVRVTDRVVPVAADEDDLVVRDDGPHDGRAEDHRATADDQGRADVEEVRVERTEVSRLEGQQKGGGGGGGGGGFSLRVSLPRENSRWDLPRGRTALSRPA